MKDDVSKFLIYVGGIKQHCLPKTGIKNPLNAAKTKLLLINVMKAVESLVKLTDQITEFSL
jgi:hypothetical protein